MVASMHYCRYAIRLLSSRSGYRRSPLCDGPTDRTQGRPVDIDCQINKGSRALDRTINMGLGSQVRINIRLTFAEHSHELGGVTALSSNSKAVGLTVADLLMVSNICELVEVNHAIGSAVDDMTKDSRADKLGISGGARESFLSISI